MITMRPGSQRSHAFRLLQLLTISGEFPTKSFSVLGGVRIIRHLVLRLTSVQDVRMDKDSPAYTGKMFSVSGRGQLRTIRLCKCAFPLIDELHPGALECYLSSFGKFSSSSVHISRNHRVAEVLALCMMADIEFRPYVLPELQKERISQTEMKKCSFYIARNFKKLDNLELNKTIYTRVTGALFYSGGCYAVYNTRNAVMKWNGMGEYKALQHIIEIARLNTGLNEVDSAVLLGSTPELALKTMLQSDENSKRELRFDTVYKKVHFVPTSDDGVTLLKTLTTPDWNRKMLNAIFGDDSLYKNNGIMEYDAFIEDKYIYSHLDSDIARLYRFSEALKVQSEPFEVLCYPWQVSFLETYLGSRDILRIIDPSDLAAMLGKT